MSPQPPDSDRTARLRGLRLLRRSRSAWVGTALVGLFVSAALLAGVATPYEPTHRSPQGHNLPPSSEHWLGTDSHEYDVLTRVIYGSRLSLLAGGVSIALAILIGAPAGALAGFYGGRTDAFIMRSIDVVLAFPSILIALLIVSSFGSGWGVVILAVGLINVPIFARQVRATLLMLRNMEYVTAAVAMGARSSYVLTKVLLPALIGPTVVLATLGLGSAILEVAGLSFLGIAGDPSQPEWGTMLAESKESLATTLWPAIAPGAAISLAILGFNLLGDGLRDALDPQLFTKG